ncbi:hypothetical protein [Aureimonas sp. ME7]|uniref:hypothetical protein n=1 Tax=Aureimonas sp. ME7 TaxID=2744252 RepID=UPI0015F4DB15|nr:hypothetical protein [Aureimonas sp. ME7]
MKPVVTSTILHTALLTWGLWSFGPPEKLDMGAEALPVTLISDMSEATQGDEKAPEAETSAPTPTKTPPKLPMDAQNVGDNEVDLPTPPAPKAAPRESVKTAAAEAPPPPPPPTPKVEPAPTPKPEPTPPEEVAEEKPEPTPAEPVPEIDPLAAEIAKAEAETPAPPRNVPRPQVKPKPPEPVKVAEAKKPEPVKEPVKEAAKTPDKPKETKKPAKNASSEKSFDADEIAALLNTQDSSGGGAKRSTQQAALGAKKATGGTLSQSEMDALIGQISQCWNPPAGSTEAGSFRVKIAMRLSPSGDVEGMPEILSGGGASMAERTASEAAVRAVRRCAPYNLPAEKYDTWAQVTVNFDPSQMF